MALGGVATGSINAHDAAKTVGIANNKGFSPRPIAIDASMGRKVAVEAVLLVISVKNTIKAITITTKSSTGQFCKPPMPLPIQLANPVELMAEAILKPPPNKSKIPHGNRLASFHSNNPSKLPPCNSSDRVASLSFTLPAGTKNNAIDINIEIFS